uniref:Uncharacterized protein n=1 Tax=Tanacetum cinerariifolium TaxID=118510 RepID=A0A6L2M2E3_TANCI|nr:hypothetical protein [Tanacetum cinerariifolium]
MNPANMIIKQGAGSKNQKCGSPRSQETILGDRPTQTRFKRLSKQPNEPPLSRVNTLGSGEDSVTLIELMKLCTKLSERVFTLENIKTARDLEITNLKKRVKRLKRGKSQEIHTSRGVGIEALEQETQDLDVERKQTKMLKAIYDVVTYDTVMLRVFPITLIETAKRWVERLYPETVDSWDLLKRLLSKGTVHHLRLLSSLKKSVTSKKMVTKHYSKPVKAIQTLVDHSQKWHDNSSSRNIDSSSNSEGIAAIVSKLGSLGTYLEMECPLNEEVKSMEEVKYGEFDRLFPNNSQNDSRFNRGVLGYGSHDHPSSGERRPSLTIIINKYMEEATKRDVEQDKWLNFLYRNTKNNRENHDNIIQGLETKVKTLKNKVKGRTKGGKFKECDARYCNDIIGSFRIR